MEGFKFYLHTEDIKESTAHGYFSLSEIDFCINSFTPGALPSYVANKRCAHSVIIKANNVIKIVSTEGEFCLQLCIRSEVLNNALASPKRPLTFPVKVAEHGLHALYRFCSWCY